MRGFWDDCHQIEIIAGRIYQRFAVNRSYAKEVREVFQRLSLDESAHARHLEQLRQTDLAELDLVTRISREKVRDTRRLAEQLFFLVERGGQDEAQALDMAIQIEQEFIKVHVQNAFHFYNRNLAEVFARLRTDDQDHIDRLNDCLRWWQRQRRERNKAQSDSPG